MKNIVHDLNLTAPVLLQPRLLAAMLGAALLAGCLFEPETSSPTVDQEHVAARETLVAAATTASTATAPASAASSAPTLPSGMAAQAPPTGGAQPDPGASPAVSQAAPSPKAAASTPAQVDRTGEIRRLSRVADLPVKPHLAYEVRHYVHHERFDLHIMATTGVDDWTILKTRELFGRMVGLLRNPADAARLAGHQIFIITDRDPDLRTITGSSGGYPGHRNTGTTHFTVINQDLICTRAVDTLMPHLPPIYREWETPVHEFGHAIEHALRLESQSDSVFGTNMAKYDPRNTREYFTTALQNRLDSPDFGPAPAWEQAYLDSVFKPDDGWRPDCRR